MRKTYVLIIEADDPKDFLGIRALTRAINKEILVTGREGEVSAHGNVDLLQDSRFSKRGQTKS